MKIAAIIVGIDGWEQYTEPLVESILKHEPGCEIVVVDNDSEPPYPVEEKNWHRFAVTRIRRACYSNAINHGQCHLDADWYIVLSNDVLCIAPFAHILEGYSDDNVVGPLLKEIDIETVGRVHYLEGWAVAISRRAWGALGGWDENYKISSYEDVDTSHRARKLGFTLIEEPDLGFVHLDQKQRFYLVPDYWDSEYHNREYFKQQHGVKA